MANVAFHLSRDAGFARMEIDDVAAKYQLPDLRPALSDYVSRTGDRESFVSIIGGRRTSHEGCQLPFNQLEVWTRARLQGKMYHHPHDNLPPQTVNVSPPSSTSPQGSCSDAVLVNTDCTANWPYSGLRGMCCLADISYLISIRACCHSIVSHHAHHSSSSQQSCSC
jgi:hypothetical protein